MVVTDAALLRLLRIYLSRERPYAFSFENDPVAAFRRVREGGFDVLVTDDRSGVVDGGDLARVARAVSPDIKTVVMTGSTPPRTGPAHIDAWLIKPFYVPALLVLIDWLLLSRAAELRSDVSVFNAS